MQKAMMNLCTAIAKHKYQTMEALVPKPIAMPSKTACNEMANMIKKPLIATWNEAFSIFAKTSVDCGFFGAQARKLAHFKFRPHTHCTENSSCCPVNYDQEIGILLYVRCHMVSTNQADSRCFYFRISWILMEWQFFFSSPPFSAGPQK